MAYEKQHFIEEQIVTADDLNHMEEGIAEAYNYPVTSVNGQTGNVIITDVRNSTSGATGLWTFGNGTDGYGFQAGCGEDGFQFNFARQSNTGTVNMWVNGSNQGGAIYTEGNPPPANPLAAYPVGSIYMSTDGTSPAAKFGGSWEQIVDRFLVGAGSGYPVWSFGGEYAVTLTVDQMPSHNHGAMVYNTSSSTAGWAMNNTSYKQAGYAYDKISYTGGGAAHNNIPPYVAVYMWRRTA